MFHDLSYLAGLVDGEGSVGFYSCGRQKRFYVEIKMTDEAVIDWLKLTFGGFKQFRPRAKEHHRDQWRWRVQGSKAKALYARLRPILKIKNTTELPSKIIA